MTTITTASGLQYEVIKKADGPQPKATDVVTVHYEGKLIDGKVFEITADESMLNDISAKYKVGNISKDEKNIYVRVISEQPPTYECKTCKPDLEDLYLYYFD